MTGDASCAGQVVVIVNVTISAGPRRYRVTAGQREPRTVVVKGCIHPVGSVVTGIAGLWEIRADVIRVRRSLVVLEMAGYARGAVQIVVVVDMAIGAGARRNCVQSRKRESGAGVVERRVHPVGGVVTGIATLREIRSNVIRIRRSLVVLEMAGYTCRAIQAVVVVDMAIGAGARRNRV